MNKDITDQMADERTAITQKLMSMRHNGKPDIWKPDVFHVYSNEKKNLKQSHVVIMKTKQDGNKKKRAANEKLKEKYRDCLVKE